MSFRVNRLSSFSRELEKLSAGQKHGFKTVAAQIQRAVDRALARPHLTEAEALEALTPVLAEAVKRKALRPGLMALLTEAVSEFQSTGKLKDASGVAARLEELSQKGAAALRGLTREPSSHPRAIAARAAANGLGWSTAPAGSPDSEVVAGSHSVSNNPALIPAVSSQILSRLPDLNDEQQYEIRTALKEMVLNAMEHGNLRMGYEAKTRLLAAGFHDHQVEVTRRGAVTKRKGKLVTIDYSLEPHPEGRKLTLVIRDQGKGFTPKPEDHVPDVLAAHGRGIFMIRHWFKVAYSDGGRTVTLEKVLTPDASQA
jgi:anti-sigma regulatory factor (Ser/Thr protein kinase)